MLLRWGVQARSREGVGRSTDRYRGPFPKGPHGAAQDRNFGLPNRAYHPSLIRRPAQDRRMRGSRRNHNQAATVRLPPSKRTHRGVLGTSRRRVEGPQADRCTAGALSVACRVPGCYRRHRSRSFLQTRNSYAANAVFTDITYRRCIWCRRRKLSSPCAKRAGKNLDLPWLARRFGPNHGLLIRSPSSDADRPDPAAE
jgi:hypothetical protein